MVCMPDSDSNKQWVLHLLIQQLHIQTLEGADGAPRQQIVLHFWTLPVIQAVANRKQPCLSPLLALLTRLDDIDKFWF